MWPRVSGASSYRVLPKLPKDDRQGIHSDVQKRPDYAVTRQSSTGLYDVPLKEVLDDIKHLRKTLKQSAYRLDVTPAECRKCSFVFSTEKLSKPSKCPQCRSTWLDEPVVQIIEP
jgi:predicted Zn-ribbon and HTH transcriptional regulator